MGRGILGAVGTFGLLGIAALAAACDRGPLQPSGGNDPGRAAGTAPAGAGASAGGPPGQGCAHITTTPGVVNPCGTTYSIAFSPDGTLLATGVAAAQPPNVHLWRLSDGVLLRDLEGIRDVTYSVAFSPDGKLLATAGGYGQTGALDGLPQMVKIWNVADGSVAARIPATCRSFVSTVVFSHDGALLMTAGGSGPAEVWRVADGSLLTRISYPSGIHNARFSPSDGEVLLGGIDNRATLWSLPTGALLMTLSGTAEMMADAAFSPDGGEIATTGLGNNVALWNAASGALRQTMPGHTAYVSHVLWIGRDRLVSNDWDGNVMSWTRAGSGDFALSGSWSTGGQSVGIAVSPDQTQLVAGGAGPTGVDGFVFLSL